MTTVSHERLTENMTAHQAITVMCDGNPGALTAVMALFKNHHRTDPGMVDPIFALLHMDSMGLHGSSIWILYSDICDRKAENFITVIRATQLGILDQKHLFTITRDAPPRRTAADLGFTWPVLVQKIRDQIGAFAPGWDPERQEWTAATIDEIKKEG